MNGEASSISLLRRFLHLREEDLAVDDRVCLCILKMHSRCIVGFLLLGSLCALRRVAETSIVFYSSLESFILRIHQFVLNFASWSFILRIRAFGG